MFHRALTAIKGQLAKMPWERKAKLVLAAGAALPWWLIIGPWNFSEVPFWLLGPGLMLLFIGAVSVLLSKPLGWFDFSVSRAVPAPFSAWWGDATKKTAQAWNLYLGLILIAIGLLELLAGGIVSLLLRIA